VETAVRRIALMSLTADHNQAFDDAYSLAGKLVTIEGTANIQAIDPENEERAVSTDEHANLDDIREKEITIKSGDLPSSIDGDTEVVLDSITWRIASVSTAGKIGVTLSLQTP